MTQYGNRLVIPHKHPSTDKHHSENLQALERWANSMVVNKLLAGTGVTLSSQAQASGPGAQGSGVVEVSAGGGETWAGYGIKGGSQALPIGSSNIDLVLLGSANNPTSLGADNVTVTLTAAGLYLINLELQLLTPSANTEIRGGLEGTGAHWVGGPDYNGAFPVIDPTNYASIHWGMTWEWVPAGATNKVSLTLASADTLNNMTLDIVKVI